MTTKIVSVFNNKGGVGKTTLTFHLAHALAEMGHKVLLVDLDPQCNLSIYSIKVDEIQRIWDEENNFIDEPGFDSTRKKFSPADFDKICSTTRTMHFLLKPTEEGTGDITTLPPALNLSENLDLIPGRLTIHMYEEMVAKRWSDAFIGQPLAIRTLSEIRRIILEYGEKFGYTIAIIDTSPSLGMLNKVILSTVDAFLIPCAPDLFSLYGVRNIGNSLSRWSTELKTLHLLVPPNRRPYISDKFVKFLGYTVYNAKLRNGASPWNMAKAHYHYASQIPNVIAEHIPKELSSGISDAILQNPIGDQSVMHSHNTFPANAQKYRVPMWKLPDHFAIDEEDINTIRPNSDRYLETRESYKNFANSLMNRIDLLGI